MKLPQTCSAEELAASLGRPHRWVLDAASSGVIPSLKVGGRVRFTEEMVADIYAGFTRAQPAREAALAWGRPTRGRKRRVS